MLEQFGCVAPVLVHEEKLQGLLLADHLAVREYEGPPQPRNMPTISLLSILTVRPGHGNNMQHSRVFQSFHGKEVQALSLSSSCNS